jgi:HlyD family type I secretion membrane fusion protein
MPSQQSVAFLPPSASSNWWGAALSGYIVIAGTLGVFLLWTLLARLDGAAIAPGVVSVESSRKTVQHLEGGIIREILVRDGDLVQKDQVLIRLDPTRVDSTESLYRDQLAIQLTQGARFAAERDVADSFTVPKEAVALSTNPAVKRAIEDEQLQFSRRRETVSRAIEVAESQIAQAKKEAEQNEIDNKTARATLVNINSELASVRAAYEQKLVTLSRLTSLEREQLRLTGVVDGTDAGADKVQQKIQELTLKRAQAMQDYRQDAANKLADIQKSLTELRQQLIVATDSQSRIDVRAPATGVVQQLRVFTVGGVVRPGDPILDLVPSSDSLIIRARISPLDADRVTIDMGTEIRFPSFRGLELPIIHGTIVAISRDRLIDEATKDSYFDAQIRVDRQNLPEAIVGKLSAGMPADVIVPTGERTVFAYLVTPLTERFATSMRER